MSIINTKRHANAGAAMRDTLKREAEINEQTQQAIAGEEGLDQTALRQQSFEQKSLRAFLRLVQEWLVLDQIEKLKALKQQKELAVA